MKKIIFAALGLTLFISCTTIPVPESESDNLTVIYTEFREETKVETFGSYMFEISNADTGHNKYFKITKDQPYFFKNLEPGLYKISYIFVYDSGSRGTRGEMFTFFVNEGQVKILQKKIIVRIYDGKGTDNKSYMTRFTENLTLSDLETLREELTAAYPEMENWNW